MAIPGNFPGDRRSDSLWENLHSMNTYGGLLNTGSTAQTLVSNTAEILEGWTADMPSRNMTPAFGSDNVTVIVPGDYFISFQSSFNAANGVTITYDLRVNDVSADLRCYRVLNSNNDVGSASFNGIVSLSSGDVVTVYVTSTGTTVTIDEAQLSIMHL